ncbi:MAG TPA: phosphoribosylanthranilate isomerase [Polyangia bacterium]|nr:phosphoribosylanthranilate isomerase [Polyangia bacterium]
MSTSQDASAIVAQVRASGASVLQLCDRLIRGSHADLRAALPGLRIVQVIHVLGEESVSEALAIAPAVDALLLDSGNPGLAVKQLGGTGRCHDWRWSCLIRERSPVPVFLAGGLQPDNVAQAIAEVSPLPGRVQRRAYRGPARSRQTSRLPPCRRSDVNASLRTNQPPRYLLSMAVT